ncbi:DoxX family protein [Amycolatopsis endophytica]|uniref:Putative membrane protein YphA (DoxX/SURF4 family) n=1 Tax=Amycolatopsis endophytica TaxID=860233 RepID=A0A853BAG7_9PSEU|nr:DoxX family protein [Amycolatopsis endophytica]NYI92348.1 putative membrane protein YphA (DoxX/SURF4 family) [Amycolatopsis endophytica]
MTGVTMLSIPLAVIFATLGMAKILAIAPMRQLAADVGFSVAAYRRIGVLELLGAAGVLVGLAVPFVGVVTSAGLAALLAGAVITHVRNRDRVRKLVPSLICGLLVAGHLTALALSP